VLVGSVAALFVASCAVGPNYKRPGVDSPGEFRRAETDSNAPAGTNSFADVGWWEAFNDSQLTTYLAEALTNSWDIKIAAARVLQAEASARITRSQFFPTINAGGDLVTSRTSEVGPTRIPSGADPQRGYGDVFVSMNAYEIDSGASAARMSRPRPLSPRRRRTRAADVVTVSPRRISICSNSTSNSKSPSALTARTNSSTTKSREEGGVSLVQDVYQA
jgi:multidrug efflux system outer membrane protein